ncbi:MAG: dolichyl-phosphate beta-glucosyltransferase [Nanoarchaeota archaeon]
MELSVIIPAYNEEKRIGRTLEAILGYLDKQKYQYEIIVVNDGSSDKTKEVVQKFKDKNKKIKMLDNPGNKGKGYSVQQGFLAAEKEWVLFTDADLSTPIEELETFFRYASGTDVIIGSRNLPMSQIVVKQPFFRSMLGKIFPFFVRVVLLPDIKDSQCGFKLFRKEVAQKVAQKQMITGFCFDVEILFLAKKFGFGIQEIPITWSNDERSKIRIISDSFAMFFDLLKIRWNALLGRY